MEMWQSNCRQITKSPDGEEISTKVTYRSLEGRQCVYKKDKNSCSPSPNTTFKAYTGLLTIYKQWLIKRLSSSNEMNNPHINTWTNEL